MANNGPTNPNGSFIYDTAVYYDESDPRKSDIQTYRDKLEHNKWGFSVCDPHRDGHGEQMKRFKQSFQDSRHAVVFLSPDVLKRMNENLEDGVEFKMVTFLTRILESHDTKMKRRLIPVMFGTEEGSFQKPFLLSDFSILCPEKRGFYRHLYRSLSKLPGPDTITQRQIQQRVDTMGRDRYTDRAVTEVATGLEIPEEVLEDIKQEYGGHKAMLIETVECWRLRHGPEATVAILDRVLEMSATSTPLQVADLPPQSMVRTQVTQEPPSITPIQRQTTTCEVQRNAEGTSEAPDTVDENLTVNSEEAQLHELELLSESETVNNATQAHNSDENELTETEGPQLSPEPEVDNNVAEPPETSEENLSDGAEGSHLVHLEQEVQRNADETDKAPNTAENLTVNSEEAQPHESAVNNATEGHNSDEGELTETEGARLSPEPEVDNNAAEPPETTERNLSDGAEGSHLVHLEQEVQRNADETDKAPNTAENLTVNSEEAQPHESEVDNNAAQPPETSEENLSDGAEGSQLVHLEQVVNVEADNNAARPPETCEEKLSDGAEGSQLIPLEQGTRNVIVNYNIRNIYITNTEMVQVGDSNSIQVSQTDDGEENLEEEEEEDDTPDVEEATAAGSQLGTPQDTSNDQNNDRPVDMQQFEEDCAAAAPELDGPPDIRQVESGAGVEDNTAEKPPVSSNTEDKTVSDGPGPEEQASPRVCVQGVQNDQAEQSPVQNSATTNPDVEAISEGVEMLKLDRALSVEPSQGDPVKKKRFLSGLFRSRSLREADSDNKEKKPSFLADLRMRLTPQKLTRSNKKPVQRSISASCTENTKDESIMMTRSSSFDTGRATAAAASGKHNPPVPAKPTTDKAACEGIKDEEKLVSSLPNPPSDKLEEKNGKTKKKNAKAPVPLAAT